MTLDSDHVRARHAAHSRLSSAYTRARHLSAYAPLVLRIFGLAMPVAVIIAALHFSEERAVVRLTEKTRPWWLAVAIVLDVGTYLALGQCWRVVTRTASVSVPVWVALTLSLATVFIDQPLSSGGISGTVVVARALEQHGLSPRYWLPMVPGLVFSRGARDDDAAVDAPGSGGGRAHS